MALSYPSRIGNSTASYEAQGNLSKLLRMDPRGGKEQVTTELALKYFQETRALSPGYLDGVKSWAKSGMIYVVAGAATAGAIGLAGYGIWRVATPQQTLALFGGLCGTAWISHELGYRPIEYVKALLAAAVRDSANRAANSSVKNDEKTWQVKETKIKECHEKILSQLSDVYNDCAQELHQNYQQKAFSPDTRSRLELKLMADRLEKRLPAIEKLLTQLDLGNAEVEEILQRFKDAVRLVQKQVCTLYADKSCEKMNAELIAGWSTDTISDIAVPYTIKERASAANKCQFSMLDRTAGYGSAALSGVKILAISTTAIAAISAAINTYQIDFNSTMEKANDFFAKCASQDYRGLLNGLDNTTKAGLGLAVFGATAQTIQKSVEHSRDINDNAEYVASELNACREDLKTIYTGVANHLKSAPPPASSLREALRTRLPAIQKEIQNLELRSEPSEVLGNLEYVLS